MKAHITTIILILLLGSSAHAQESEATDETYIKAFNEKFTEVAAPPSLDVYATPARYDDMYLGDTLDAGLENLSNVQSAIAWGLSYRMMSLNEMYKTTKDPKYLEANLKCIRATLAARDDKTESAIWTGEIAPAWSSDGYAERGRAVFLVHTGIILAPMLEALALIRGDEALSKERGEEAAELILDLQKSIAWHDRQWRDGPGENEGHYVGLNQEDACEGKPLPGNRLAAMGAALWQSWKLTGDEVQKDKAERLGWYIKNRLGVGEDGAYYWPYWLDDEPVSGTVKPTDVNGEDVSHASLTVWFPFMLAQDNAVFTREDMTRFGKTVTQGFGRLGDGILLGTITGQPSSSPNYVAIPARWLHLSKSEPSVADVITPFYLRYIEKPGPLDLALLCAHGSQ